MERPPEVLVPVQRIPRSAPAPRLRLLIEWESRHRVFLDNLADLFLRRPLPPLRLTSKPARFWGDVFVSTGASWSSFMEALLWQVMVVILLVWAQSRIWVPVKRFEPSRIHQAITYYPPTSFPAAESRASKVAPRSRRVAPRPAAHPTARQTPMQVRPEQRPSLVTPPDIKQAAARPPALPNSHAAPMVPFSSTAVSRRNSLTGSPGAVAPPVQVDQSAADRARRLVTPQATVVAPAPEVRGSGGRSPSAGETGGLRVVPPPPAVQSAGNSARARSLSNGGPNVVPPAPSVPHSGEAAGDPRVAISGAGSQAIPPPPSVRGAHGNAGAAALGAQAVPPPPSADAASSTRSRRLNSLSGSGSAVVPPAPSVRGTGKHAGNARVGSLSSQAVPPPPSIAGSGSGKVGSHVDAGEVVPPPPSVVGSGGGKVGSLSGAAVVPPAPSIGSNSGNAARAGSLPGEGSQVVPPAPSVENAGNAGGSEQGSARTGQRSERERELEPSPTVAAANAATTGPVLEPAPVLPTTPSLPARNEDKATIEELPLGLLGLVFAAPGSSYFSNFEVFVAKRRMGKDKLQLIKLVYEFLPYQKRLSEYNLNNLPPRVIKLRVIPDPSCNESLGQIIQPAPDPSRPVTEYPKLPVALSSADLDAVLPCYRTSAGDFEKAMAKSK